MSIIPKNWEILQVQQIASSAKNSIVGGPFGSDLVSKDYVSTGVPVIRGQNMGGIYIDAPFVFVSEAKAATLEANLAKPGDLIFTQRGTLGQVCIVPDGVHENYLISQSQMKLSLNSEVAVTSYVYHAFNGPELQKTIQDSAIQTGVPHLNLGILRKINIKIPPLKEQRAIASALSDMDALLARLDQLIAKKRDIKQAAMQELLKGRRRLPGFDRKWEQHPLGKMLIERPTYGINAPAVPYSLSLPTYIRITDITDDGKFSSANPASVSHPSWAEYKLSEGDIVLARTGASTGKSYRYKKSDGTLIYAGFLIKIKPDPAQLNPAFLECHLNSTEYWKWVQQTSMRSGQPGINGNEYARLSIPLPSIEEQTAIASILMEMGQEITALEARREKTRLIKQGMMQELLSGRVRLI